LAGSIAPCRVRIELIVDRQRAGEGAVSLDLLPRGRDFPLGGSDRIGAGEEPQRQPGFLVEGDERRCQLGGITALRTVGACPERFLRSTALAVVCDREIGISGGFGRQQFGTEKARIDDRDLLP
jgi:hypothetical protein